jgi:RNA polymerase sigma-70 factor (ECF subfamily)
MNRTEIFNECRPLLMAIAYRMLGSRADAEDAVQETFLRWQQSNEEPTSPKSYLSTIITRLCIDQLRSARAQREVYVGPWLPEPVMTEGSTVEMAESLTMAFLIMLETLGPAERAAFLLHDVFDFDYPEIAQMIGKSEANSRQMVFRARERLIKRRRRFEPTLEETERITSRFIETTRNGDLSGLMAMFAEDAIMTSDGGGKARAALNPVHGAGAIARFIMGVLKKNEGWNAVHTATEVNGQPAFVTSIGGQPISVMILDVDDGVIQNLFIVVNPDKLRNIDSRGRSFSLDQGARDRS